MFGLRFPHVLLRVETGFEELLGVELGVGRLEVGMAAEGCRAMIFFYSAKTCTNNGKRQLKWRFWMIKL